MRERPLRRPRSGAGLAVGAAFRRFAVEADLALVCDLPQSRGYQRWLIVGLLAKRPSDLVTYPRLDLGDAGQAETDGDRVGHGA